MKQRIPTISEVAFQRQVIEAAQSLGWLVMHSRPSRTVGRDGTVRHATALQGHSGFPDLVLSRRGVTLLVELKSNSGRLGLNQLAWLGQLTGVTLSAREWESSSAIPMHFAPHYANAPLIVAVVYPRHWRWLIEVLQNGRVP